VAGELNKALNTWAQKDLAKATDWMDRKISSGAFDDRSLVGDSAMRIVLEQALLHVLLTVDPAAAGRRLAAMTEEGAFSVLSRNTLRATRRIDDDAAFATLARATLSETRKIELFSNEAERLSDNTAEVSEYLDRIDATPIEREACVEAAAGTRFYRISSERPVTLEDLETLREWAGTNHSDIDRMTGKALGNAIIGCRMTFEEASALVLHYYEASGDDSVIRAFLASEARSFGDSARALAEKIADPEQRAEILEKIW